MGISSCRSDICRLWSMLQFYWNVLFIDCWKWWLSIVNDQRTEFIKGTVTQIIIMTFFFLSLCSVICIGQKESEISWLNLWGSSEMVLVVQWWGGWCLYWSFYSAFTTVFLHFSRAWDEFVGGINACIVFEYPYTYNWYLWEIGGDCWGRKVYDNVDG